MCIFLLILSKDSPLFDLNSTDLAKEKFELIVIMEGTIEASSMTFQARYVMMNIIMIIIIIMTVWPFKLCGHFWAYLKHKLRKHN